MREESEVVLYFSFKSHDYIVFRNARSGNVGGELLSCRYLVTKNVSH